MGHAYLHGARLALLTAMMAGVAAAAPPRLGPTEAQSIALGRQLAQRNCGMCHSLADHGPSPHQNAPPFRDLYQRMDMEALGEGLTTGILTRHPAMPEFRFQPNEVVAIVRYLRAMQSRQSTDAGGRAAPADAPGRPALIYQRQSRS